jgi:hypothetical protein
MRWQTTVVLAVILAALGGFYYVYEVRMGPAREKAAAEKGRLFASDPTDVTEVWIRRNADVLHLKRDGDGWQMLEPVKARGAAGKVNETMTNLLMAKVDREIAAKPDSLADFGLDKPAADVTLTLKDGKQLGLLLGQKNPTGTWVYARERDKPAVVALGESVLRDATLPATEFRDRTVLALDAKEVSGVDIVTPTETLSVESAEGRWRLTRPVPLQADTEAIGELLEKLRGARVKEFVAEAPRSLEPYALERPWRLAIHAGRDKERTTRTLLLGRFDDAKKGVYAMRPGETSVLLLPEDVWKAVPKNVAAIRNKVVFDVESGKVTRLEIESPKGAVTLARDKDRWAITAPESLPADQVEAGAVLTQLRGLRAQAFLAEDASGIARWLARPEVRVTVTEQGGAATTVLLAPSPERRSGQPTAYAAIAGKGPVVLVEGKALADLGRSALDLRDRTLLGGLEPKDVKRLRVTAGGQTALLERKGESDWRLLEPVKGAAKIARIDDLLYALRALKWKEIAAPRGEAPAQYGLDAPTLEVALLRADGSEIAAVLVGRREAERAWVKLRAAPAIYLVDPRLLGEPPKVPDDFKG